MTTKSRRSISRLYRREKLLVFTKEHPRPKHSLNGSEACLAALRKAQGK